MRTYRRVAALAALLLSSTCMASGQRDMALSADSLDSYPAITLQAPPHDTLHYVGSSAGRHLLMITLTSVSQDVDGRPMMPFDSTYVYTISSKELHIENGWDISVPLKEGIDITPRDCPAIPLNRQQSSIALPDNAKLKQRCLTGQTFGMELY